MADAPTEVSIQGKLKRDIKFAGDPATFQEWKVSMEAYLDEWLVTYHLENELEGGWTSLQKYNNKCVYSYLTTVCSGKAKTKISMVAIQRSPKLAWDKLALEFDRRIDIAIESLIGDWFDTKVTNFATATLYIKHLEELNNALARKGKELPEEQCLSKVKRDLIKHKRYKQLITSALLDPTTTMAKLKSAVITFDILVGPNAPPKDDDKDAEEKALNCSEASSCPSCSRCEERAMQGREQNSDKRRDGSPYRKGKFCTHCGKEGHF
jgi:hypothetical protein